MEEMGKKALKYTLLHSGIYSSHCSRENMPINKPTNLPIYLPTYLSTYTDRPIDYNNPSTGHQGEFDVVRTL